MINYTNGKVIPRYWAYSEYFIRIFKKSDHTLMDRLKLPLRSVEELNHSNKACADSLGLDQWAGIYYADLFLDPNIYNDPQGYFMKYDECCRDLEIDNIANPFTLGLVHYAEFPNLASNPDFSVKPFPLIDFQVYCVDESFESNFGGKPELGLTHKYYLDTPLLGYTTGNSPTRPLSDDLNYPSVSWKAGFSENHVFDGSPTLTINENTGKISGHPVTTGKYTFGMRCEVYRGTELLGLFRREYAISVVDCKNEPPNPPFISSNSMAISGKVFLCQGESMKLEADYLPDYNYTWFKDEAVVGKSFELDITESGNYTVTKAAKNSCAKTSSSDSVSVLNLEAAAIPYIEIDDLLPCQGDTVELKASNSNGTLAWKKDGVLFSDDLIVEVTDPGVYTLSLEEIDNCANSASPVPLILNFRDAPQVINPTSQFMYCPGENLVITNAGNANWTYQWLKDGVALVGQNIASLTIDEIGNYQIQVSENNCSSTSDKYEVVFGPSCGGASSTAVFMPSAFTPNSDSHNPTWEIFNLNTSHTSTYLLSIYNRWGETVFETDSPSKQWDGNYRGKPLPYGEYIYHLKLDTMMKSGKVFLLR
ncbi:gliding motility-associated C-terminal domain-containing protein [Spirosomataceae bacterium TFI 002]|nr:gliding motility-associated C-terminal domain-containing protein [Spirosomataceae bacterium TFI 002]